MGPIISFLAEAASACLCLRVFFFSLFPLSVQKSIGIISAAPTGWGVQRAGQRAITSQARGDGEQP